MKRIKYSIDRYLDNKYLLELGLFIVLLLDREIYTVLNIKFAEIIFVIPLIYFSIKIVKNIKKIFICSKLLILWGIYSGFIILSSIINDSYYYLGFGNIFIIGFIYLISNVVDDFVEKICIAYTLASMFCFLLGYFFVEFTIPYYSIFNNPNYSGFIALITFLASLHLILNKGTNKFLYLIFIISLINSILSQSTTIYIQIAVLFLLFLHANKEGILNYFQQKNKKYVKVIISGCTFLSLVLSYFPLKKIYIKIFMYDGGLFSNRLYIWQKIFSNISVFGHGRNRYNITNGAGEHNIFMAKLNTLGILPFIFLIIFAVYLIYLSYKLYKLDKKKNFILFATALLFLLEGMNEEFFGLSLTSPALFCMLIIGQVMFLENQLGGGEGDAEKTN